MPKKSSVEKARKKRKYKVQEYNSCNLCGRNHGYIRKLKICRICFRELVHKGVLPGIRKASW